METIKEVLMRRDGLSENDVDNQLGAAIDELAMALDDDMMDVAESICLDHFGLEEDYIIELIDLL